jgi:hypothetical protein
MLGRIFYATITTTSPLLLWPYSSPLLITSITITNNQNTNPFPIVYYPSAKLTLTLRTISFLFFRRIRNDIPRRVWGRRRSSRACRNIPFQNGQDYKTDVNSGIKSLSSLKLLQDVTLAHSL